ncbi:threonine synthase [Actinomyces sp. 2119]|uniref:Threonine synthase n=1 Tax=Actinomyces lilanjuaniae TaxID=2321394 RepID=A0ABN5PTP9_9ACTO|nr:MULTISPECIES: threonine synthase [Actinomyces]AYD90677.1 threonine synthase [Actinomyces lilanjuaniae]RJF43857.1 threonine synthase [Actinomyces sp. 2119]
MHYISTRGGMRPARFTEVLLSGLAPDGGLVVPLALPSLSADCLEAWRCLDYAALASKVIGLFATDVPEADLQTMTAVAYGPQRFPAPVVPVRDHSAVVAGLHLVGLSEGPTMAFKDLAMQFLGQAVPYVLDKQGQVLNILGATSGDTGSAAEHAFRGQDAVNVFMLSPAGRMSPVQRAQMYSLHDPNIHNIAVEGVFDDCQDLVKTLSNDIAFKERYSLGAVNSINIGRIVAQAVYYVWAWLRVTDRVEERRRSDFQVDVCVPSGNFGNVYAGHIVRSMGLPIRRLIVATNENNVLEEFFSTGIYTPRSAEATLATSSPSMDISKASNLERFLWSLLGPERFSRAWRELEDCGSLDLSDQVERIREEFGFIAMSSSHAKRLETIRFMSSHGVTVDPHTADGITTALNLMEPSFPTLVLETARPEKFLGTVGEALGFPQPIPNTVSKLLALPQRKTTITADEQELRTIIATNAVTANSSTFQ